MIDVIDIAKQMIRERGDWRMDSETELLNFALVLGARVQKAQRQALADRLQNEGWLQCADMVRGER